MADVTGFTNRMKAAQQSVQSFHKEMANKASAGHLDNLADRAGIMGLGLAAGFGYAVKAAADFDKEMSAVGAGVQDSAGHMKALRAAAIQAGKDTQYSATAAAQGITELGKAGLVSKDILAGGLKGALDLAAAGQISVGEAAETAASAMTEFKLSGSKVPHVADLLAAAAGKAQGSVHDMGAALNQTGLVASQTGLTIEETTGGLAAFANAGLIGSDAGTSFKQMLLMLQAPSQQSKNLMDELGISLYDSQGKFIGLAKFAGLLQEKLKNLTPEARSAAMAQIFGADATRAASIMYENGAKGIQGWINKVNETGYAQKTASKLTDNLAGDVERLKGSLETMAIEAGSGANSGLRVLVKVLNGLVNAFANMNPLVSAGAIIVAGLAAALLLGMAGWIKYRRAVQETRAELEKMGPAGQKASSAIGKLSSLAGAIGGWTLALEAGSAALNSLAKKSVDVDKLTDSLGNLARTGKSAGEIKDVFGGNWDKLGRIATFANGANHGFGKFVNTTMAGIPVIGDASSALGNFVNRLAFGTDANQATQNMSDLDTAMVNFMNTTHDARKASDLWNQILTKSGLNTEQLAKLMPNAYKQLGILNIEEMKTRDSTKTLSAAVDKGKEAQEKYTTAAEAAAGALRGEQSAFVKLSDAMKAETDPVFGLLNAQRSLTTAQGKAKTAQDALTAALKKHGPKSAEAKAAADKLKIATEDVAGAAIDLQGKVGTLGAAFDGKMSPSLINTMKAAGLTDKQIKILSGEFKDAKKKADDYDGTYKAEASAPGAKDAKKQLNEAYVAGSKFAGPYVARLSITGDRPVSDKLAALLIRQRALASGLTLGSARAAVQKDLDRNRVHGYAIGGWTGPGAKYEPAGLVHKDEFVVRKESRRKFEETHPGALDHLNQTGELPGYAAGGQVMKFNVTAAKTKIPSWASVAAAVQPHIPSGGMTYKWILSVVRAAFPDLHAVSTYRPGARTLTGNESYHARGQAVDFPPSHALAQWWHDRYGRYTNELITPWNSLNIWKGRAHRYHGAIWNQHNFAGGNAHDHIALSGSLGGAAGALGSAILRGALGLWISTGMRYGHVPSSWGSPLTTLIKRESGGNPNAINRWDANARAGHPSQGLMQLIPSTFAHYRLKNLSRNILDPVANIVAGIRYIKSRYGSIFNVQQANPNKRPRGYSEGGLVGHTAMANGGVIGEPVFGVGRSGRTYSFGERGPETVLPGYAKGGLVNVAPAAASSSAKSGSYMDTVAAMMAARDAIDQVTASLQANGRAYTMNTAKGRENLTNLFGVVRAAQAAAEAKFEETGSVKSANKVYNDYIKQLDATLKKMKVNTATRRALIKAYSERPTYAAADPTNSDSLIRKTVDQISLESTLDETKKAFAWTKPSFNMNSETGRAELTQLFSYLSAAKTAAQSVYEFGGNAKTATAFYNSYLDKLRSVLAGSGMSKAQIDALFKQYARITLTPVSNRWGGIYHAAGGVLSDAMIAPGGPTRYAWAEPSTGGELFAPKNGNLTKTRAEVGWAVQNWWGGDVSWGNKRSAPVVINATIPIVLGSQTIQRQVRLEVDTALGEVTKATVYQTA
jgi:TP901 family phage tail tape measure protein